jgi:threonine dehydrogenase-like Zn-dependent dehydrogenase
VFASVRFGVVFLVAVGRRASWALAGGAGWGRCARVLVVTGPGRLCSRPTGVGPPVTPQGTATSWASDAVLKNLVIFGSVNANRRHYYRAAQVLAKTDRSWLEQLVTRRIPVDAFDRALERDPDDIKVVIEFAQPSS